jgi:hypothetical protein
LHKWVSRPLVASVLTLNGLFDGLKRVKYRPGQALEAVIVSITPSETSTLAQKKKDSYLKQFGFEHEVAGFHFLTGEQSSITQLANALGPDGMITKGLPGIRFPGRLLPVARSALSSAWFWPAPTGGSGDGTEEH